MVRILRSVDYLRIAFGVRLLLKIWLFDVNSLAVLIVVVQRGSPPPSGGGSFLEEA